MFPVMPPGVTSKEDGHVSSDAHQVSLAEGLGMSRGWWCVQRGGWGYVERGWGYVHGGWLCPEGVWYVWGGGGGYTMGPGYTAPPVLIPGGGHQHTYGW